MTQDRQVGGALRAVLWGKTAQQQATYAVLLAMATSVAATAQAATPYVSEYGRLLTELDYPGGKPYFNFSRDSTKLKQAWANASPQLSFTEVEEPASRDRSRRFHRWVSSTRLVPVAAVQAMRYSFPKSGTEGPTGWHEYWVKTLAEPLNGASTRYLYARVERRLVQCEPGGILMGGTLYFASLDAEGEPYETDTFYDTPLVVRGKPLMFNPRLSSEIRHVCQPILAATLGEQAARAKLDADFGGNQMLALMGISSIDDLEDSAAAGAGILADVAARPAAASASASAAVPDGETSASAAEPALTVPPAASASAPVAPALPLGEAKARIRIFAQNGIGAGLSDQAGCTKDDSMEKGGSGFFKALASTFHVASNETIGMPESQTTRELSKRNQVASEAYYTERQITADMPVTLQFSFGSPASGRYCPTIATSFVPRPNADYEAMLDVGGGVCQVKVTRILANGVPFPVVLQSAPGCPPQAQR